MPVFLLASCSSESNGITTGSGSVRDWIHTATGAITEAQHQAAAAIEWGKMGIDTAQETYESAKSRGALFNEGVKEIQAGKEKIHEALK